MKEIVLIILISHFSYNQVTAKEPEDEHDVSSEGSAGYALRSRTDGNYVHSRSDVSSEGSAGYALTSRADESYVDSRSDADKPIMPNIGYLFMGYDIISGNPMPTESIVDPGFREKIFKASYAHERETDDRRYTIPDHIDLNSEVACQIDFTSETIETEKEYQKDLLAHVAVSATGSYGVVTGSFSASTDYSKMSNKFQSNSNVLVKSEAVCLIYKAFIQSNNPPRLTRNFKRAVKRLAAGSLGCVAFFESFGTHYLKQVDFGSRYAKVQEISKSKKEDLDEEGIDINVAASVSVGQSYGAEVEVGLKTSKKNRESYSEAVESTTEVSIGSVPPSDGIEHPHGY